MKWTVYQGFMIVCMILVMASLEYINKSATISSSSEWTAFNSKLMTFLIIGLLIAGFYSIFLLEAKKKNYRFQHQIWEHMPKIIIVAGIVSVVLFLLGGTVGPLMEWMEHWRFLLYILLGYFLLLVFLFIFSFEHKRQQFKHSPERIIHISFFWTLLLFFAVFFLL